MRERLKNIFYSTKFTIILGLVIVPAISFFFITLSEESPLYTSISRIAWIHGRGFATFVWAVIIMTSIVWLTYRMIVISPLSEKQKKFFGLFQFINICLVFIGCLIFPAKSDLESIKFMNYIHDYLTIAAWAMYGIGLIIYSFILRKKDKFLGFLGLGIMSFIVFSAAFFISHVIDPSSYVGASAVSEVYIINSLFIYLVVMYIAEDFSNKLVTKDPN